MARKKKTKTQTSKLMLAGLLLIALLVWEAIESKAEHQQASAIDAATEQMMAVEVPQETTQEIIHYPGFTVSFNKDYHQPNWVAWELTADEVNATETHRSKSNFAPDPNVDGCASLADYARSGYDRGHMCPAADMKWSQQAMDACFLLTNMCPQHKQLNTGAWNSLENKCRSWAQRDSAIVIICGPILTDRLPSTIGPSQVPVPERFFKVVLAPYANPVRGIGFIMPNGIVDGGMQAAAVSIDEVEQATGFDFFAFLPDDVEDAVESECNFPRWSKR